MSEKRKAEGGKRKKSTMLKIGLAGVGHLGKIHLKCILEANNLELVGCYDQNMQVAKEAAEKFGTTAFDNFDQLLDKIDILDIVTPTITHFEIAKKAIEKGKHVFIEKPLTHTLKEAEELIKLSRENKVKVQVGHVERFNPAFISVDQKSLNPRFVEAHRLATFNPRGTDVSVVLDLMIHDLDILLSLVQSKVKLVQASGVAVVSETPDICNARIEFENGCVANLTASRISMKQMRKMRLFQKDAYISLDFLEKNSEIIRLYDEENPNRPSESAMTLDTSSGKKHIHFESPAIEPINAIKEELSSFADSIENQSMPAVSIADGYNALKLAHQIIDEIEKRGYVLDQVNL